MVSPFIFENQFQMLNPEQRKAVETVEGPVMCIAGPGTGKTQTLAMRVANILKKTQARPGNILCLTFSSSGATAMRERLRLLIGADAYGVNVSTIHGFCQSIINDHPALFDTWSALEQISDVERFRELNKIIDAMLPDLALINPKSPYVRTKDLIGRISDVKREGKTGEDLHGVAAEFRVQMEGKSKPGTKVHEKNLLAARKFEEFAEIFDRYQTMLQATGRYDYDDMILYVIRALEEEDWLLAKLQERYQYFLVDEFQDTNGAQYRVIDLLTRPVTPEDRPNLFVVGDDDQAIYRFQGANLRNILSFHERFPGAAVVTLQTSYRSTQSILDAAGRLIAHNTERLVGHIPGLVKQLHAFSEDPGSLPILLRPPSDSAEPWMVADLVEERLMNGTKPQQIAIITQRNSELFPLFDVLRGKNIPVRLTGKQDLLTHPLVLQAVAILKAVQHPDRGALLADALGAECFRIPSIDLARLYQASREAKTGLRKVLYDMDDPSSPFAAIPLKEKATLVSARDLILDLHQKLPTRTVTETLDRILHETGILAKGRDIHPLDLAALQVFFDRAKERQIELPGVTFEHFMADLELYANPDYGLRMSYDIPHLVTEGVQLLTAHQSKGLEFETVIIVNFREGLWDKHRNPGTISLPEDLLFGWGKEQKAFEKNQDERRVAFVAMTRAKKELIFSCPKELTAGNKAKAISPSAFFAEAGPLPEEERGIVDPEHASTLLLNPQPNFDAEMRDFLTERLKTFALSPSALNRFLNDPVEFLRIDLLQVPQVSEYALAYGNAVHWAMRKWAQEMQKGNLSGKEFLLGAFTDYLEKKETSLSEAERSRLLHLGRQALPRYFDQRLAGAVPFIDQVEKEFVARLDEVPIKGKIDRIDRDHPEAAAGIVIDYKTGRPQTEAMIRDGDYFRQIQFYAVLLELAYPSLTPRAFVFDFIGEREEHPVLREFQITSEEKEQMRKLIKDVWGKISALDFSPL